MNQKKITTKMRTSGMATSGKFLRLAGIAILASSVYLGDAQAQSLTNNRSLSPKAGGRGAPEKAHQPSSFQPPASSLQPVSLIAQNLGGIVRKIPLEEVALPAMSSAKTATNAAFSQARIELKSDGSLIYILRGKNQQGFEVEVQVTPSGTLIQVDEQIESSGVPEIALKAFKKWAPNDPLISTWRSTRLGEFFYQFVIRDFWLEIAADGNKVVIYRKKINI
ncbi:hypothetical protein QT990_16445 [Microcoleus sp. T3_B1]|uniref:hypothetical protein n=1 Tax=Microcoleus sp. T3_B1 TaxID=3055425 RepID=UPI002FCF8580